MMGMYFTTDEHMTDILIKNWNTYSIGDALLAAFIAFLITLLYEGLKIAKSVIITCRVRNPLSFGGSKLDIQSGTSSADLLSSLNIPSNISLVKRKKKALFVVESLLYTFSFMVAYILMLLVMTYSVWFLVAVIIGSGLGYFFIQPIGVHISNKYIIAPPSPGGLGSGCHSPSSGPPSTINSEGPFHTTQTHI